MRFIIATILAALPIWISACDAADPSALTSARRATRDGSAGDDDSPSKNSGNPDDSNGSGDDGARGTRDAGRSSDGTPAATGPLVSGLAIREIAVFQGVKIAIVRNGQKVTPRNAPVVAARDALVRVYVSPDAGFSPHATVAQLRLSAGGTSFPVLEDTKTITAASTDELVDSTFNFRVPAASLPPDVQFSVALREAKGGASSPGTASAAQYPTTGALEALEARSSGAQLKVRIVPIRYEADGAQRAPDTSPAQIELYRKAFQAAYPAAAIDLTVRDPVPWQSAIAADGSGWAEVLEQVHTVREQDKAAPDVYYHGVFSPAASESAFCSQGCVAGLCALLSNGSDDEAALRGCVGLGFSGESSAHTAVHEIGHAHGREHAPCDGEADADAKYPYAAGSIGAWGYDITTGTLFAPSKHKDFMSYCEPAWVSDYTYKALFERMVAVNRVQPSFAASARAREGAPPQAERSFRYLHLLKDGATRWGRSVMMRDAPRGETRTLQYLASNGTVLGEATAQLLPLSDISGGMLLVPELSASWTTLRVSGPPGTAAREIARAP
jgi:hypothetical protein